MKTNTIKLLALATLFISFSSCSKADELLDEENTIVENDFKPFKTGTLAGRTITNLYASQVGETGVEEEISGDFTKFNFATGQVTEGADWDIAFRATTMLINGGETIGLDDEPERTGNAAAYIGRGIFDEITTVNTDLLIKDGAGIGSGLAITTGSGNGWYMYTMNEAPAHTIHALPGKILIIRTHDGAYVKMEIISYYKDAKYPKPVDTNSRYYTFNYVYQAEKGNTSFVGTI